MLFAALQAILFIVALKGIQNANRIANRWLLWIMGFIAIFIFIYNIYYWWQSYKAIQHYRTAHQTRYSHEHNLQYLNTVLLIQAACLTLWLFSGGLLMFNMLFSSNFDYEIIEKCTDGIWLVFQPLLTFWVIMPFTNPKCLKCPVQS